MKNKTLDSRYADHVDTFCNYVKQNIHRVLQRKCRCGHEAEMIYRTVKVGIVKYKKVPFLRCDRCKNARDIGLIMMAAQMYAMEHRMKHVNCAALFDLKNNN